MHLSRRTELSQIALLVLFRRELWLIRRSTFRERPRDPMVFPRERDRWVWDSKNPFGSHLLLGEGALKTTNG